MGFTRSSQGITLELPSILVARCQKVDGGWHKSSVPLDTVLGNDDGVFVPGGRDFSLSAESISLTKSDTPATILRARLRKIDGSWRDSSIDLDAFVTNTDGWLSFVNP